MLRTRLNPLQWNSLLTLIPEYASWKDFRTLWKQFNEDEKILSIMADTLTSANAHSSLIGKWAPREGSGSDSMARALAKHMGLSLSKYRKLVTGLNKQLKTPQIFMAANDWSSIDIKTVTAKTMSKHRKAFLDELVRPCPEHYKGNKAGCVHCERATRRTDKRRHQPWEPNYDDRNECREHVLASAKKNDIKGANAEILDFIRPYLNNQSPEDVILEAQYRDYVSKVREGGKLNGMLALSDVSSSMSGDPMLVSIFLGLLIADLNKDGPFTGRVLTFESNPQLFRVDPDASLHDKIHHLAASPWGGSTNVAAAYERILEFAIQYSIAPEQMPHTLVVLSDMQFDQADYSTGVTSFQRMRSQFEDKGYVFPRMIFWNLRSSIGVPTLSNVPGVTLMSGFSPQALNCFVDGKDLPTPSTPEEQLRAVLDHEKFAAVRAVFA